MRLIRPQTAARRTFKPGQRVSEAEAAAEAEAEASDFNKFDGFPFANPNSIVYSQ